MRFRQIVSAIALLSLAEPLTAQAPFQLRDGVIIDPAKGVAFVMSPGSAIRALEIRGGRDIWSTTAAAKPLAIVGDMLVAQVESRTATNMLHVVALNASSPTNILLSDTEALPAEVMVGIDGSPHKTFWTAARPVGENVEITWMYSTDLPQGIVPQRRDDLSGNRAAPIGARLGQPVVASGEVAQPTASAVRSGGLILDVRDRSLKAAPVRVPAETLRALPPRRDPVLAMSAEAAAFQGEVAQQAQLMLLSADGRHILESILTGDDRVWEQYTWTIRDRESGRSVGSIKSHMSVAPFYVREGLVIFATDPYTRRGEGAQPLKLRAYDLETGRERWSVEVRDTQYRGSLPP